MLNESIGQGSLWSVYLIFEGLRPVYVGRTSRGVRTRFRCHIATGYTEQKTEMHRRMRFNPHNFSIEILATTNNRSQSMLLEYQAVLTYRTHVKEGGYNVQYPSIPENLFPEFIDSRKRFCAIKSESSSCTFTNKMKTGPKPGKYNDRNKEILRLRLEDHVSVDKLSQMFDLCSGSIRSIIWRQRIAGNNKTVDPFE